jgi:hypothetical protein
MYIKARGMQLCLMIAVGLAFSSTALAQTDAEQFAEGRTALDKFKDCPAALKALEEVSAEGRKNPLWLFYMAKTTECLNRFSDALRFYEEYDHMIPGQTAVLDKIGELRYAIRKKEEALREEEKYGSLEETKAWLRTNALDRVENPAYSRGVYFGNRRVNFNGNEMLFEGWNDAKSSVALGDLDPEKVLVPKGTLAGNIVHCYCRNGSKCITTEQGTQHRNSEDFFFNFSSEERASSVGVALRHAIRLSQQ